MDQIEFRTINDITNIEFSVINEFCSEEYKSLNAIFIRKEEIYKQKFIEKTKQLL